MDIQKNFAQGLRYSLPHQNAPDFVKGQLSIKVDEFINWIEQNKNDRGWINIDIKESRGGKLYCELNNYGQDKKSVEKNEVAENMAHDNNKEDENIDTSKLEF